MKNSIKNKLISICIMLSVLCFSLCFLTISSTTAKAASDINFVGSNLRMSTTNNGLRFVVEMDKSLYNTAKDADAKFGMLILPSDYLDTYAQQIEDAQGDYVKAFTDNQISVINLYPIEPYAYDNDGDEQVDSYRMNGVISNVKYANLSREFVGIAYVSSAEGNDYAQDFASASTYQNAEKQLAENIAVFEKEDLEVIYEYKYLAEAHEQGVEETTARAEFAEKKEALVNGVYYGVDGYEVLNFDNERQLELLRTGPNYDWNSAYKMTYEILEDGFGDVTSGVLKIETNDYASLYIKFAKPVKVKEDSNLIMNIYQDIASQAKWSSASVAKYNTGTNYNPGTSLSLTNGAWTEKVVALTTVGYSVGDIAEGIQIILQGVSNSEKNGTTEEKSLVYIDEIRVESVSDIKVDIANKLNANELLNFNDEEYGRFVKVSNTNRESFSIKDGVITVNTDTNYTYETFPFLKDVTFMASDYLCIKIQSNARTRMQIGSAAKDIIHGNGSAYGIPSNKMQTLLIPLADFSVVDNTVLSSIQIATWGVQTTYQIDDICYISPSEYEDGMLADLTHNGSQSLISKDSLLVTDNGTRKYAYPTTVEYADGYVKMVASGNYNGFQVKLASSVTVTENTQITIRMRYVPNASTWSCRIVNLSTGVDDLEGANFSGYVAGEWCTVTFNAVSALKATAGSELSFIEFAFGKGTVEIASITYSELA